jgi:hypothetical protein
MLMHKEVSDRMEADMAQENYMFIDGAHFRRYYVETVQKWFPPGMVADWNSAIDWSRVIGGPDKCFYYDCVDDQQKEGESDAACAARVGAQEEYFASIKRMKGTHVRLGSLTGAKKNRRQKKVDVLLATDMLQHAFRGNIHQAILVTGDLDFEPVVKALVDVGVHVHLRGDASHTSRDLVLASDSYTPFRLSNYVYYTKPRIAEEIPLPSTTVQPQFDTGANEIVRWGSMNGRPVKIVRVPDKYLAVQETEDGVLIVQSHNQGVLERFCAIEYVRCEWE